MTRRQTMATPRRRWLLAPATWLVLLVLLVLGRPAQAQTDAAATARRSGFDMGGTGETIFEHTRASLRDPHFGMRLYLAPKVPGTLSVVADPKGADVDLRAAAPDGKHLFWDVAFGERAPLFGWYDVHPTKSIRHARGFQVNLDAAAFLLLDFTAQSSAVINTDYRLGLSADLRPWRDGWDRLSVSVGFFHQSTHLGDEYTLSATTIQGSGAPAVNPALPYRANPSYLAFPVTASVDLMPDDAPRITARMYLGASLFAASGLPEATRPEFRGGLEFRYGHPEEAPASPHSSRMDAPATEPAAAPLAAPSAGAADPQPAGDSVPSGRFSRFLETAKRFGLGNAASVGRGGGIGTPSEPVNAHAAARRLRRGARSYVLAYEVLAQRKYHRDPATPGQAMFIQGDGRWLTHHLMTMLVFNLDTERSTSNAIAVALEYLDGRNQHGQLVEYDSIRTAALSLSYYW